MYNFLVLAGVLVLLVLSFYNLYTTKRAEIKIGLVLNILSGKYKTMKGEEENENL